MFVTFIQIKLASNFLFVRHPGKKYLLSGMLCMNIGMLCMHVGILCMHVGIVCSAIDMLEILCMLNLNLTEDGIN